MRETRVGTVHLRSHTPLAVLGSSPHTFRGLGLFAEAGLLFCGGYLLAQVIVSPLNAGTVSVIGGGLFLALATVLLFYLTWPIYAKSFARREEPTTVSSDVPGLLGGEPLDRTANARWRLEEDDDLPGPM
jgi:hypothetical protein